MKRKKNQNPNSGTQLPKSQTSKSSTQKQNFSLESFYPNFKMQTKKLKKIGYQICSSKDNNNSFPNPPKEIKFKENKNENSIPTLLQHFTSNPSKILYPKKKKNLKKISTKFQCKQNKIQNIGYKCYLGNH
jgi:hypothetical protein